jgi:ribosomal protein L28
VRTNVRVRVSGDTVRVRVSGDTVRVINIVRVRVSDDTVRVIDVTLIHNLTLTLILTLTIQKRRIAILDGRILIQKDKDVST